MLPIERDLIEIEGFSAPDGSPSLSLYLNAHSARDVGPDWETQAEKLVRAFRAVLNHDGSEAAGLEEAKGMALQAILALRPPPRSVAAFSCPRVGFCRVVPLPEPTVPAAYWGQDLQLKGLMAALDEHECCIIALVDKEHAQVYRVFLGQMDEIAQLDRGSRRVGYGGRVQRKFGGAAGGAICMGYGESNRQRREQWHVRQHLDRVLAAIHESGPVAADRLLVGGGTETVHELLSLLPRRIRDRTRLISGLPVGTPPGEILDRVLEVQAQAEREGEEELLDNLMERDRALSVFGAAAVLEAVSDSRVHTLVYGSDLTMDGCECTGCGWLMTGVETGPCPRCGASTRPVSDLVALLVSRVADAGGRIEEVRGRAQRTLARREGLGALLRYNPAPNVGPVAAHSSVR